MEERKTGGKLKTALIAIIILAIGIFMGFGIVFYFRETKPATGHVETEPSSEEVYQYALEYLKHANEDAAEPEAIEYSAYSSDAVGRFPATEELSSEDEYVPCDHAKDAETITHRMYTVNITMTYAGQAHKVMVFEYVSEGYSPLHHHGCLNEDGEKHITALKTTDSNSPKGKTESGF